MRANEMVKKGFMEIQLCNENALVQHSGYGRLKWRRISSSYEHVLNTRDVICIVYTSVRLCAIFWVLKSKRVERTERKNGSRGASMKARAFQFDPTGVTWDVSWSAGTSLCVNIMNCRDKCLNMKWANQREMCRRGRRSGYGQGCDGFLGGMAASVWLWFLWESEIFI